MGLHGRYHRPRDLQQRTVGMSSRLPGPWRRLVGAVFGQTAARRDAARAAREAAAAQPA
jgi:hypothetical protein